MRSLSVVAILLPLHACADPTRACEAGRVVECSCQGSGAGFQACKADGSGWEACDCSDGGSTGGETTGETGEGDTGRCGAEMSSVLPGLDTIPAGFDVSVQELLAGVGGDYSGTFAWNEPGDPIMEVTHAGTTSDLSIGVRYEGGEIRLYEVEHPGSFPDTMGGFPCGNTLDVDVAFSFTTADGVFDERLPMALSFTSHGFEEILPRLNHRLDFSQHQGSLDESDFIPGDAGGATNTLEAVYLTGTFMPDGAAEGSLEIDVHSRLPGDPPDGGWVGHGWIAGWNATVE